MKHHDVDGIYLGMTWKNGVFHFAEDRLGTFKAFETADEAMAWLRKRRLDSGSGADLQGIGSVSGVEQMSGMNIRTVVVA